MSQHFQKHCIQPPDHEQVLPQNQHFQYQHHVNQQLHTNSHQQFPQSHQQLQNIQIQQINQQLFNQNQLLCQIQHSQFQMQSQLQDIQNYQLTLSNKMNHVEQILQKQQQNEVQPNQDYLNYQTNKLIHDQRNFKPTYQDSQVQFPLVNLESEKFTLEDSNLNMISSDTTVTSFENNFQKKNVDEAIDIKSDQIEVSENATGRSQSGNCVWHHEIQLHLKEFENLIKGHVVKELLPEECEASEKWNEKFVSAGKKGISMWHRIQSFYAKPSIFKLKELQFYVEESIKKSDASNDDVNAKVNNIINDIEAELREDLQRRNPEKIDKEIDDMIKNVNVKGFLTGDRDKYFSDRSSYE